MGGPVVYCPSAGRNSSEAFVPANVTFCTCTRQSPCESGCSATTAAVSKCQTTLKLNSTRMDGAIVPSKMLREVNVFWNLVQ